MATKLVTSIVITDGRIHELLSHAYSIHASDTGTWCELFKTNQYKKRKAHVHVVLKRCYKLIRIELANHGIEWTKWTINLVGSDDKYDVRLKINQAYQIVSVK